MDKVTIGYCILILCSFIQKSHQNLIVVTGPGLEPENIILPARYFFVNFTFVDSASYSPELAHSFAVEIEGRTKKSPHCRVWANKLDRKDGTFIVRYKIYETCYDVSISLYYKSKHIKGSPYTFKGPIHPDQCNCPEKEFETWLTNYGCSNTYGQIEKDLKPFQDIEMKTQVNKIIEKYHQPESTSFCHYVIKDSNLYRDCYGKHVGFNMFSDNILLALLRKVRLPDVELVINLGDWPLIRQNAEPHPMFSWCGSNDTIDIVMPTYDITESTLENMAR
ncbi:hypothetical protein O3G_MSEX010371 [Manduca sexta]|uniref:Glycosyl transferase CAP10 domain-containing protein n=2 Tax=Manduca sexta TaxID=7130 RepID=A0A921ZH11_MANSE|nr:hypothetical protein O3G_MSEX010371 [Manduca sexta]